DHCLGPTKSLTLCYSCADLPTTSNLGPRVRAIHHKEFLMRCHLFQLAVAAAAVWAVLLIGESRAQQAQPAGGKHDPVGEPKGFKAGESARYAVWYTKKGWHVRTTTAKKEHHFTGKIWVEGGVLQGVEPHDLEHKGKFADWWKVDAKGHELV